MRLGVRIATPAQSSSGSNRNTVSAAALLSMSAKKTVSAPGAGQLERAKPLENINAFMEESEMSQFRGWEPLKKEDTFRVEDSMVIDKLLESKKLTDKQRDALRRLVANFNYIRD